MNLDPQRAQRLIHQHLHDVRNSINCLNLEAEWLDHLPVDPEVAATVTRMRAELTELEAKMQALQCRFFAPRPSTLAADELLELWQHQIEPMASATRRIKWSATSESRCLVIDVEAILSVLRELVITAWQRTGGDTIHAALHPIDSHIIITLRETHKDACSAVPNFEEVRRIIEINGGNFTGGEKTDVSERVVTLRFALV